MKPTACITFAIAMSLLVTIGAANAQAPLGSAFTYQGYLEDANEPANDTYYMQFRLYDAPSGGMPIVMYPAVGTVPVTVQNGLFTVSVDFGFAPFSGDERWMEIEVNGVTLSPRQELTPTPYGLYAISAGDSQKVGGYTVGNGAGQVPVSNGTVCSNLNADLLDGQHGAFYQNADNMNGGTLPSARLSGAYNNALSFPNGGNSFTGSGAGLTNLNASNLASGTVPDARLSANVALLDNAQTFTGAKTFSAAPSFTAAGAPFSVTSATLVTNLNADLLDGVHSTSFAAASHTHAEYWALAGNAGTSPGTDFLGTTDDKGLELHVNGARALRIEPNATSPNLIVGFSANSVTDYGNTIGGGGNATEVNTITSSVYSTISGGRANAVVGASNATIAGGRTNQVQDSADDGTIGGGKSNIVSGGSYATVGGGESNTASDRSATVCGGEGNTASGQSATVCGGEDNVASGYASFVAGGQYNTALGQCSFAAGHDAEAMHNGAFVWSDSGAGDEPASTGADQWIARARGGFWLYSNGAMTAGVRLPADASAWSSVSDRNLKDNFRPINPTELLQRVGGIPIETWNYKSQDPSIRHIGPVAQDFYSAFGVGEDDKHISTIDADGVALAAIQGLNTLLEEQQKVIDAQRSRIDDLEARLRALEEGVKSARQ